MNLKTHQREPLETLQTYPVFQHLLAKAETHELQFRPKEAARLSQAGALHQVLLERTQTCWNTLRDCRAGGMNEKEAEEVALPSILLPSEKEEEQAELEQKEQMESQ